MGLRRCYEVLHRALDKEVKKVAFDLRELPLIPEGPRLFLCQAPRLHCLTSPCTAYLTLFATQRDDKPGLIVEFEGGWAQKSAAVGTETGLCRGEVGDPVLPACPPARL